MSETPGRRLRDARKRAGLTQVRLAKELGVAEGAVNAWERDQRLPETANLMRLAELLDVSTDYLLLGRAPAGIEEIVDGLEDLLADAKRLREGGPPAAPSFRPSADEDQESRERGA